MSSRDWKKDLDAKQSVVFYILFGALLYMYLICSVSWDKNLD